MLARLMRPIRDLRWRLLRWSAASDRRFHDELFAQAAAFDPFAASYSGNITIRRFAELAQPAIQDASSVLDLGCGPGEISCELAARNAATRFVGVDHSEAAIEAARRNAARLRLTNVRFVRADVAGYDPGPDPPDVVTMFDSFHHLEDPAAVVATLPPAVSRVFLIEPAGNIFGQWRESHDFDWVAADLDLLREKLDAVFGIVPETGPAPGTGGVTSGKAVERRYTYDDFQRIFAGYALSITGTSSGLTRYPPAPALHTEWRRVFGDIALDLYEAIDRRLITEEKDLWSRHWAILAVRGGEGGAGRRPKAMGRPLRPPAQAGAAVYGAEYLSLSFPAVAPADRLVDSEVTIRNTGALTWGNTAPAPTNLSYHWTDRAGVRLEVQEIRTALSQPVAPGEVVRLPLSVRTPRAPGRYILLVDLVREGVTWFSEQGVRPRRVRVRVR